MTSAVQDLPTRRDIRPTAATGFAIVHLLALGIFWVGFSWTGVALCIGSYYLRMFAITAGFHRYFSHRTYKLNRFWQFMLALLGQTAAQKGVLWWAAHHRHHHKYSDQPEDIHSPIQRGFWWSHIGWILADDHHSTDYSKVSDLTKYPELRWLNRHQYFATVVYAIALFLAFGWTGLFYGYFLSTVLLWHGTFSINSVMHVFGRRVFETEDDSRNSMIFALVTMGEGWHNNHHYYPGSAAQGFRWWQVDASYYLLKLASLFGIVRSLRGAPTGAQLSRQRVSVEEAQAEVNEKIEALSQRWSELRHTVRVAADHALFDLEQRRVKAVATLDVLQAEYAAARTRAGKAADLRMRELAQEIERVRLQLADTLERLVSAAQGFAPEATFA